METAPILAIDPGTRQSAWVLYDPGERAVLGHGLEDNTEVLSLGELESPGIRVVCEMVASYGRPVGAEVFETVKWIGRFEQRVCEVGKAMSLLYRRDVTSFLCGNSKGVNDAVVRQRLIDLFGPSKEVAVGRKASPGPLYGIRADEWQALALAVTFAGGHHA